jgi:hypothetical protein
MIPAIIEDGRGLLNRVEGGGRNPLKRRETTYKHWRFSTVEGTALYRDSP